MRSLLLCVALAVSGCDRDAAAVAPAAEAFHPTAFTVEVTGHGRPVILIPGLGCPGSVWEDTVAKLDGYQTHVLTLAGFAGNPRIELPLVAETRRQLAEYIRANKLHAPVIVGHSMGGTLAYLLAEDEPDLVGPTVIVDAGAALGDPDTRETQGASVRDMWKNASDAQYAQQVRGVFGSMAVHRDRLAKYLDQIQKTDRAALGEAIYELYTTDARPALPKIKAPVLAILADGSEKAGFTRDANAVPNHTIAVIPNTGHFVMIDDPDQFDATLGKFLREHAPAFPVAMR